MSRWIGGRTGRNRSQHGNGWRRWRFLTVEAAGNQRGGRPKSRRRIFHKTTYPVFCARCQNCGKRDISAALCRSRRGWPCYRVRRGGVRVYEARARMGAREHQAPKTIYKNGDFRRICPISEETPLFGPETAQISTFSENMRDYTPDVLRPEFRDFSEK